MPGSTPRWWATSLMAAAPAAALAAAAGATGLGGVAGQAMAGLSAAYVVLGLAALQPRLERRLGGGGGVSAPAVARAYLQRALALKTIDDLAAELSSTLRTAGGITRSLVVVPAPEGGVRVLGGTPDDEDTFSDAERAFVWLGTRTAPVFIEDLGTGESEDDVRLLLQRLGAEAIVPLRHRGLLLGLLAVGPGTRRTLPERRELLGALGVHTTVALAHTYLDVQASGGKVLSQAFDLATAVQEALMPDDRPIKRSGVSLCGMFRPVAECGGDLWTYHDLSRGRVLVFIGDATGHGAASAMLTAVAKGTLDAIRHVAGAELDPAELLAALNRTVYRAGRTRYLMTGFAAVIDSTAGEIRYSNAGQNFPYVVSKGEGRARLDSLVSRGAPLGSGPEGAYVTQTRPMVPGERLVLYTDGIVDAGAPGEPYGEKRFRAVLSQMAGTSASRLAPGIMNSVDIFLGGRQVIDDVTVVTAEVLSPDDAGGSSSGVSERRT